MRIVIDVPSLGDVVWRLRLWLDGVFMSVLEYFSPLIRGPIEISPDEFVRLVVRHRPRTMVAQWTTPANWKDVSFILCTVRVGRTMYMTNFYVDPDRTGLFPNDRMMPRSLQSMICDGGGTHRPIRNPAEKFRRWKEKERERAKIENTTEETNA